MFDFIHLQSAKPLSIEYTMSPRTLTMPEIKPLQTQLKLFYEMNGLKPAEEQIYREAWGIKHACGLVKRKGRRGEPTRDTWLQIDLCDSP